MEVIKLNLIPGKACPVVHVSQFDDGRDFKAELYEGVNVYTLDGTETLTAIVKKPDGNEVTAAVTNTSDNYVIITTTEQMTACAGGNLGTLRIEKGAVTIATLNFILECQASPDTGIQSDSEIHNLEAQVNQMVEDAVAEQYDSNNVLFDTVPTSGHGVPYAVTSGGLWSWLRDLPLRAYPTASGAIATFDTSLALPLQDCTIEINGTNLSGANIVNVSDYSTYFKGIYEGSYGFIDLGNVTWSKDTTTRPVDGATVHAFYTVISGVKKVGNTEIGNLLLNGFTTDTVRNVDYGGYDVVKDKIVGGGDNNSRVWVYDSEYNDYNTTEFRTAMSGKYLIYELETPTTPTITTAQFNTLCTAFDISGVVYPISWQDEAGTVSEGSLNVTTGKLTVVNGSMGAGDYQLTPIPINQLSGTNNIFCDTGNTSVVYACSLKDYIDS